MKTAFLLLSLSALNAFAQEKVKVPAGYERIDLFAEDETFETRESFVTLNGRRYRKIEYESKIFYLRLLGDLESESGELICDGDARKIREVPLAEGTVKVTTRGRLFIEGLRRGCQEVQGRKKITLSPDIRVGFQFEDRPKDKLQSKKVFLSPKDGVGFSGDW